MQLVKNNCVRTWEASDMLVALASRLPSMRCVQSVLDGGPDRQEIGEGGRLLRSHDLSSRCAVLVVEDILRGDGQVEGDDGKRKRVKIRPT